MDISMMEVEFGDYCKRCKYENVVESEEPCCECIIVSILEGTRKPEKFEEKE